MSNAVSQQVAPMEIRIAATREQLGAEAARDIAAEMRDRLGRQESVRIIFAAAPSQGEMLRELILQPGIDWSRITAFHMDEYIGLPAGTPQLFSEWLKAAIFDRVKFSATHLIVAGNDPELACRNYAELLQQAPIDLCLLGIGSNAHLAFNDPPADLHDPATVKVVELDLACRQQQVDDKCFDRIEDVPTHAITLTVPALMAADKLFCCVPGKLKQQAVHAMVHDEISGAVPATALRLHSSCIIYLDRDSATLLS
jgi:glucosamine-6-phosphate deaminase